MAEWIRHQTSDLGIAGSSPATVEIIFASFFRDERGNDYLEHRSQISATERE